MGLYVAICLLGALIALPTHEQDDAEVIAIIWGVTVGLALAHWFAFRVSAALVSDGKVRRRDLHTRQCPARRRCVRRVARVDPGARVAEVRRIRGRRADVGGVHRVGRVRARAEWRHEPYARGRLRARSC